MGKEIWSKNILTTYLCLCLVTGLIPGWCLMGARVQCLILFFDTLHVFVLHYLKVEVL